MLDVTEIKGRNVSQPGWMVDVDIKTAYSIIQSLTAQLISENCNSGRTEFSTRDGKYFSIAVHKDLVERDKMLEKINPKKVRKHSGKLQRIVILNPKKVRK